MKKKTNKGGNISLRLMASSCCDTKDVVVDNRVRMNKTGSTVAIIGSSTFDLNPQKKYQTIAGYRGIFAESSTYLSNLINTEKRKEMREANFGETGPTFSFTRTQIHFSDFSLINYSYVSVERDTILDEKPNRLKISGQALQTISILLHEITIQ